MRDPHRQVEIRRGADAQRYEAAPEAASPEFADAISNLTPKQLLDRGSATRLTNSEDSTYAFAVAESG